MRVFDYVVFYVPNEEDKKAGKKPVILSQGRIIKKDQRAAELEVGRTIPVEYDEKIDDVIIAIRPF